jgi:hypothetical protein
VAETKCPVAETRCPATETKCPEVLTKCPPPAPGTVCVTTTGAVAQASVAAPVRSASPLLPVERPCPIVETKVPVLLSAAHPTLAPTQVALN